MKKTKCTEEHIAFALRQADSGTRIEEVRRQMGISQATLFNWKKKLGGRNYNELRQHYYLSDLTPMEFIEKQQNGPENSTYSRYS